MVKDVMGNELKQGDLVALQLERPLIFGRVTEIAEGGIITGVRGGQAEMKMTRIVVLSHHPMDVDPRISQVLNLIKLHDPAGMSEELEKVKSAAPN
jgi:hypothetical protein